MDSISVYVFDHSNPGDTLTFSCMRKLGLFFFFFFWGGGVQKNEYFLGYEDFVDIFWVITKLGYI